MSRLWSRTRLRLYLAPGYLQLAVIKGHWRPAVLDKREITQPAAQAMELLDQLGVGVTKAWQGARLEVVLSSSLVRCFWRPWDEPCVAQADIRLVAAALFEKYYAPLRASDVVLSLGRQSRGRPQLIMATERSLLDRLTQWSLERGMRLGSVASLPLVAWNRFEPVLRQVEGPLVVIEGARATLLCHDAGILQEIYVRPCPDADSAALRHAFGAVLPSHYRVFAPQSQSLVQTLNLQDGPGFSQSVDRHYSLSLCGVF